MEYTNTELKNVQETVDDAVEQDLKELNELQMALVGGGSGEVVFH